MFLNAPRKYLENSSATLDLPSPTMSIVSGSLRTEPGTGNRTDLEPEPAEPDTEPEPAEPEPEKCKLLTIPKNQKSPKLHPKSKNNIPPPSKIKEYHRPTPPKGEGWGPLGPQGSPPLFLAGWGDVIL